jgi:hypothetical protein
VEVNEALEKLNVLNRHTSVTDTVAITNNLILPDLDGLSKLVTITGGLTIWANDVLVSLAGMSALNSIGGMLTILDNPELETCAISPICTVVSNASPDMVDIEGNKTGCETREEVEQACITLPVTLVSFSAVKEGQGTMLSWSTSSETKSAYFEVQHSFNAGSNWKTAGKVMSQGESSAVVNYHFTHSFPVNGENLYRLKMVDEDGSYAYSRIQNVTFADLEGVEIYPNPVVGNLLIRMNNTDEPGTVEVYNILGQLVISKKLLKGNSVATPHSLETAQLPAGLYNIHISVAGGKTEIRKFVRQ